MFATHFIHWIAAYPLDNVIHPLNNWGQSVHHRSGGLLEVRVCVWDVGGGGGLIEEEGGC